MTPPAIHQLSPYQKRLYQYLEQAMANLPAGTADETTHKYLEELLDSVVDHDIARELEKVLEDLTQKADEMVILHAEGKEDSVESQLEKIRESL